MHLKPIFTEILHANIAESEIPQSLPNNLIKIALDVFEELSNKIVERFPQRKNPIPI